MGRQRMSILFNKKEYIHTHNCMNLPLITYLKCMLPSAFVCFHNFCSWIIDKSFVWQTSDAYYSEDLPFEIFAICDISNFKLAKKVCNISFYSFIYKSFLCYFLACFIQPLSKIVDLVHLQDVHLGFYLAANKLIADKLQNIFNIMASWNISSSN